MSNSTTLQERNNQQVKVTDRNRQAVSFTPLVDIIETKDEFVFQADLPGVQPGDLDLTYENGILTISGAVQPRQPEHATYAWQEFGIGNFFRQFSLKTPINPDGIKAALKCGVLELHLPKADAVKLRKIAINAA